jgi:hypothetical protein
VGKFTAALKSLLSDDVSLGLVKPEFYVQDRLAIHSGLRFIGQKIEQLVLFLFGE